MDSSGLLQDSTPPTGRFRPYASTKHRVTRGRYITSNDPRGYIPVYEYPLNGQYIMMDIDDGYILWTGIWKALGNAKADIVKMLESQPDLAPQLRRVRGGYLKIQGTWMPYEVALRLARRVAWTIREDLIPLFGPTFPSTCLSPDQPGYGQILGAQQGRRRGRRAALALPAPPPSQASMQPPVASGSSAHLGPQQGGAMHGASGLSLLSAAAGEHSRLGHSPHIPTMGAGASSSRHAEYRHQVGNWGGGHGEAPYPGSPTGDGRRASGMVRPHATNSAVPYGPSDVSMGPPPLPASSRQMPPYGSLSVSPKSAGRIRDREGHPGVDRHSSMSTLDSRFSPYPTSGRRRSSSTASGTLPHSRPSPVDLPPLTIPPPPPSRSGSGLGPNFSEVRSKLSQTTSHFSASTSAPTSTSLATPLGAGISLPPIKEPAQLSSAGLSSSLARYRLDSIQSNGSGSGIMLPPISSMDGPSSSLSSSSSPGQYDSSAVLNRLKLDDETLGRARLRLVEESEVAGGRLSSSCGAHSHQTSDHRQPTTEQLMTRRRSLSAPPPHPDYFLRRMEPGAASSSPHPFARQRASPTGKSRSPAGSASDSYRSQGGGGTTSMPVARGPLGQSGRSSVEGRSPPVLSPRADNQHHRPLSSGSSHSRLRVSDDRLEGERSREIMSYDQHVSQKSDVNSRASSTHSLTPPGANSAQAYAVRSSQPGSQDQSFPPPNYNAELASYRFGQHAEAVRDGSPLYRSNEGSNLDMEIEPDLPIGFHSSEAERRERIRPW